MKPGGGDIGFPVLVADIGAGVVASFDQFPNSTPSNVQPDISKSDVDSVSFTPRHIEFHPTKPYFFVVSQDDAMVYVFKWGSQEVFASASLLPNPDDYKTRASAENSGQGSTLWQETTTAYGSEVHFHPTKPNFVYAATRGYDSIALLIFDDTKPQAERLTLKNNFGIAGPKTHIGLSPRTFSIFQDGSADDDSHVLLANCQDSHNLVLFQIDSDNGTLSDAKAEVAVNFPASSVAILPNAAEGYPVPLPKQSDEFEL